MARHATAIIALAAFFLTACTEVRDVELTFRPYLGEQPLDCGQPVNGMAMTDLRFFVYDVELQLEDGGTQVLRLHEDGVWQSQGLALVDLEDGSGSCRNGSAQVNSVVRGTSHGRAGVRGVSFRVGVPETLNHADPVRAAAPLNLTIMHWHWRSGYKFMRAGIESDEDEAWLHLGSSGCRGTIGRLEGCDTGNRVTVEIAGFDPQTQHIAVDLEALFAATDLSDGIAWNCQSGVTESHCDRVFASLGIEPADSSSAKVFRAAGSP